MPQYCVLDHNLGDSILSEREITFLGTEDHIHLWQCMIHNVCISLWHNTSMHVHVALQQLPFLCIRPLVSQFHQLSKNDRQQPCWNTMNDISSNCVSSHFGKLINSLLVEKDECFLSFYAMYYLFFPMLPRKPFLGHHRVSL